MSERTTKETIVGTVVLLSVLGNAIVMRNGLIIHPKWYWALVVTLPLLVISLVDFYKKK